MTNNNKRLIQVTKTRDRRELPYADSHVPELHDLLAGHQQSIGEHIIYWPVGDIPELE